MPVTKTETQAQFYANTENMTQKEYRAHLVELMREAYPILSSERGPKGGYPQKYWADTIIPKYDDGKYLSTREVLALEGVVIDLLYAADNREAQANPLNAQHRRGTIRSAVEHALQYGKGVTEDGSLEINQIREMLAISGHNSARIDQVLWQLKEEGVIERVGPAKYRIAKAA